MSLSIQINALLARAGADDSIRGGFRYHGAATGRWGGEGFQPQNLKRHLMHAFESELQIITLVAIEDR